MATTPLMTEMLKKIRALVEDFPTNDVEVFNYTNSNIWTIRQQNINDILKVLVNGSELQSGSDYSFDTETNKLTIIGGTFELNDIIEVDFNFSKYSDSVLKEYIRAALTWLSIYDYSTDTYKLRSDDVIVPDLSEPENKTSDLICIVTSILIKPNYMHYRTPNFAVNYPNKMSQEEKIREIINTFKMGTGVVSIIQWNRTPSI
jgi:hypothetical protein